MKAKFDYLWNEKKINFEEERLQYALNLICDAPCAKASLEEFLALVPKHCYDKMTKKQFFEYHNHKDNIHFRSEYFFNSYGSPSYWETQISREDRTLNLKVKFGIFSSEKNMLTTFAKDKNSLDGKEIIEITHHNHLNPFSSANPAYVVESYCFAKGRGFQKHSGIYMGTTSPRKDSYEFIKVPDMEINQFALSVSRICSEEYYKTHDNEVWEVYKQQRKNFMEEQNRLDIARIKEREKKKKAAAAKFRRCEKCGKYIQIKEKQQAETTYEVQYMNKSEGIIFEE